MLISRDKTRKVNIGGRVIGGGEPIAIQSMTNTKTEDVASTVEQILRLERAGCEIIRCTVPTMEAAKAIGEIKSAEITYAIRDTEIDGKSIEVGDYMGIGDGHMLAVSKDMKEYAKQNA